MSQQYLTVSQLNRYLSRKFDHDPYLQTVYLSGEISNFDRNDPNRHQYFTLKDEASQIPAVMFQSDFKKVKFKPKHGDKVLVIGRVQLYQPHGKFQMVIQHMEPDGIGQLFKLFEQTKEKLQREGLFDLEKKAIPSFPKRIGVITSASGAVIHDIVLNVQKRYPLVQLVLYPTLVQGPQAAESIVKNVTRADQEGDFDTLIVGRGGGSFEDLFAFNEESVVRAIAACQTPVISSIGHQTDRTLADEVADYRASTPTEAAVVATPVLKEVLERMATDRQRLQLAMNHHINRMKKQLQALQQSYVFRQPQRLLDPQAQRLDLADRDLHVWMTRYMQDRRQGVDHLLWRLGRMKLDDRIEASRQALKLAQTSLHQAMSQGLSHKAQAASQLIQALDLLSPLTTLARGYSVTTKAGAIVDSVDQLAEGDKLKIRLADGQVQAQVKQIEKEEE